MGVAAQAKVFTGCELIVTVLTLVIKGAEIVVVAGMQVPVTLQ